jgi:glycerophosphoryl diester phosphodiesterase
MPPWPSPTRPAIIGHRGAAALAPENTLAAFQAAIAAGVDAVEFDVRRGPRGRLVVAHGRRLLWRAPLPLEEAFAFLSEPAHAGIGMLLDIKHGGIEAELLGALVGTGLVTRAVACAGSLDTLALLGERDASLARAWSLEHPRQASAGRLGTPRGDVPAAAAAAMRAGLVDVMSVHRGLSTPTLLEAVHAAGGEVYAWDVERASDGRALAALGVDALIVDDPRPFLAVRG